MSRPTTRHAAYRARVLTSAVLSACLLAGVTAHAAENPKQKKSRVDENLATAKSDLSETSEDLVDAYEDLKATRAKLPGAREKARKAESAEDRAQREYDDAAAEYEEAKDEEAKAEKELRTTSSDITRARQSVGGFAGRVYQNQGLGQLSVAVGAKDPGEVVDKMVVSRSVGGSQDDALSELSTSRANLVSTEDRLAALREKTRDAKETKASKLDKAQKASDKADKAEDRLEDLEEDQSSQATDLRREKSKDKKRVDSLQSESDRLREKLEDIAREERIKEAEIREARKEQKRREAAARKRATSSDSSSDDTSSGRKDSTQGTATNPAPPSGGGVLQAPVSAPVTSQFGQRFHPIHQTWRLHSGRDFGASCGTPVRAAADGRVVSAGVAGGYGNQLVIDHGVHEGASLATTYNHLQSFAVRSGKVSRGQVIGHVGTTGTSTGCHLHLETRENGTPTDPGSWL